MAKGEPNMSGWEKMLNKYGLMIEERLSTYLKNEVDDASHYHKFIESIYDALSEYVFRGGKRLASCSTLLTYRGFTNKVDARILNICAGMELYRHAILVHDDLVDKDEVRRGGGTIHAIYSQDHNARFGEGAAVFAGNLLYTLALKAFKDSGFNLDKTVKAMGMLNSAFKEVNESQILDLLFEHQTPDVEEWTVMASKRAASLFKASLLIGALLADAPEKDLRLLRKAAGHMGFCFDIQDDIIDTFASEQQYGRKPGGDMAKNKKPLHLIYTYILADKPQRESLENAMKTPFGNLTTIREIISRCGALDAAKNRSREHADTAKKLISETRMNDEIKAFFTSFIDYIIGSLDWYK